ncbi:MAG: mechanosensitive ion channel [Lautropia sp.]|nr:mechanosensitive ion channel [Lautropia sp.]
MLIIALAGLLPSATSAQGMGMVAAPPASPPDKPVQAGEEAADSPAAPAPISAANLVSRAERDENTLVLIRSRLQITPSTSSIKQQLLQLNSDTAIARRRSRNVMNSGNLRQMRNFEPVWKGLQTEAGNIERRLTQLAESLQNDLGQLSQMQKVWQVTQEASAENDTLDNIRARIKTLLGTIDTIRRSADRAQSTLFDLQTQSSRVQGAINAEQTLLKVTLNNSLDSLFRADSPQLYGPMNEPDGAARQEPQPTGLDKLKSVADLIQQYLRSRLLPSGLLLVLFLSMYGTLRKLNNRADRKIEEARRLQSIRWLLAAPFSASLLTTAGVAALTLPYPPASLNLLLLLAALLPTVLLLRALASPYIAPSLYWLLAMYAFNQVPDVFQPEPVLERVFFQGQMVATIAVLLFLQFQRKRALAAAEVEAAEEDEPVTSNSEVDAVLAEQQHTPPPDRRERSLVMAGYIIMAMLIGCGFALLADLAGFIRLARFASQATLNSLFAGMILFTGAQVCTSLLRLAMRLRPLNQLKMMARDGHQIEVRLTRLTRWAAVLIWLLASLDQLMLLSPLWDWLRNFLSAPLGIGQLSLSLGDLLRFGMILWGALLVSQLVRYVLDQEVFSRISLPRGIPYAISTMLNYLLLIGGLLLAIAATGISLDRFTIFASAVGVGVGFGLQSIVNNFVSGLIVLFARPIKVGDSVDLSGQSGKVQRIGIRASTLRTGAGADVIVPNSMLISNQVVNWTLTDPQRRIEIALTVDYESDPERVLTLLTDIARSHDDVLVSPAPNAQFADFGAKGLQFEVFAWTSNVDRLSAIRSELLVQIHKSLKRENIVLTAPG